MKKWFLASVLLSVLMMLAAAVIVIQGGVSPAKFWSSRAEAATPSDLGPLSDGQIHWGDRRYVEYQVGGLPLILSVPHGGELTPSEIPDRKRGYPIGDSGTQELARLTAKALTDLTGRKPHMVISLLSRSKLDPNRQQSQAQEHPIAKRAWLDYHGFIEAAKEEVASSWGSGLYLDIHGHGHRTPWIELGYVLLHEELNVSDRKLNRNRDHSLRSLVDASSTPLAELIRGPKSLGAYLENRGFRSVPSPGDPGPGQADYFSGGYSTLRHGSYRGGPISGIQIEHPKRGVRDTDENRRAFAPQLAEVLIEFMKSHYGFDLLDEKEALKTQ